MNLVILIQSSNDPKYGPCASVIQSTWAAQSPDGADALLYFGRRDDMPAPPDGGAYRDDKLLVCDSPDLHYKEDGRMVEVRTLKFVRALAWALSNTQADFFYRCNCTCYVDQTALYEYVQTCESSKLYSGPICIDRNGIRLVTGCDMLLSRDVASFLVNNYTKLDPELIDDIAIGKLINEAYIPEQDFKNRREMIYMSKDEDGLKKVDGLFHYKFSADTMSRLQYFHETEFLNTLSYNATSSE